MKLQLNTLLFIFLFVVDHSIAAVRTWDGSSSSAFNTGANWSGSAMPGAGDDAIMNNIGNAPLLDMSRSVTNFTINSGTFDLGGFTLTITGNATFTAGIITNGTILISGTGTTTFTNTTFNANVTLTVTANNIYFNGGTFHCNVTATNVGTTDSDCNGGCVFNGNVTLDHQGSGNWRLANNTAADDFNGNVSAKKTVTTTGSIRVGQVFGCTVAGNISFVGTIENSCMACNGGTVTLDGNADQYLYGDATYQNSFGNITVNKSSGSVYLDNVIYIDNGTLTLTQGIVITNSTDILHMENWNAATVSGGSDASHVDGPMEFYDGFSGGGIQKASFIFPVGDGGHIFPIEISASDATNFRAEAFESDPDGTYSRSSKDGTLDHINKQMYWKLDRTAGTSNVTVTLHWNANSGGISVLSELRVARWNTGTSIWKDEGNGGTTGNTTAGTVVSSAAVTTFSPFALASSTTNNPLPVELISFNAKYDGYQTVSVNWQTASEINNDHFVIERSNDLQNWKTLSQIRGGNSTMLNDYNYVDHEPTLQNYYRLIQVDYDGSYITYGPIYVELSPNHISQPDVNFYYPNTLQYFIPTAQEVSVEFINSLGQTLQQIIPIQQHHPGTYMIDVGTLTPGLQFVRMRTNNGILVKKIIGF